MQQATTVKSAMKNEMIAEWTSDRELTVTRTFDAPAHIAFDAWTKPELLKRWWAPKSFGVSLFEREQEGALASGMERGSAGHARSAR